MLALLLFTISTAGFTIYFIALPIYQHFQDAKGLRKFPTLSAFSGLSDLPFIIEAHKGFRSSALLKAHRDHPVVRIGPNSLSYGDPRAIKYIYGHNTSCSKDLFYSTLSGSHYHLADVVDKSEHARKRKVLASAYAIKNLEGWEFKVSDLTRRIMKAFDARCTAPLQPGSLPCPDDLTVDYRHWTNLFTIAAIASIGLSEDLKLLDHGDDIVTSEKMDGTTKLAHFRDCLFATAWAQSNLVWAYSWYKALVRISGLVSSKYRECWRLNKDWDGIVWSRAMTRRRRYQAGEKLDDFFSALMEDKSGRENNLEWGEMVAEISIMMNAGSDTTAIAMNNAMYLLLKNPGALAKLREELDANLDEEDVIPPYDKIKHLPYLRACLDESLRILPPVSFGLPRRTPPEGLQILDDWIPGNTSVSMSAYVVHHDPSIFPEPNVFKPERWLGESGKDLQSYFIAFSTGARGCIGRNISYLEQSVVLAFMVKRYEFSLPHPNWEPTRRENTTLSPGPMLLKIWRRDASKALVKA
ncbi:hypothetical protein CLAIMM_10199 [Cladophialophora immunda]|nr:hypothetical protein CLAIMM_10199 [Cladophialophora immunda]